MTRVLFALLLFAAATAGVGAQPPAANPFAGAPVGPVSPPLIDGPKEVDAWGIFRVSNLPKEAGVDWAFPEALKVEEVNCECDADGKVLPYAAAMRVGGPAGKYVVKARMIYVDAKTKRPRIVTLPSFTFTVKGTPGPDPDPRPDPDPNPKPDPQPGGKIKAFVVVEDTLKAQPWRGEIFGSPEVGAFYKAQKLTHRLIDVNIAADEIDAAGKAWVDKAVGKDLPWLFALDGAGKIVRSEKVKATPREFVGQLGGEVQHVRRMGNLPPPGGKLRGVFPKFGAHPSVPKIPRDQWKPVNLEAFLPPVYDQDGVGACNAFASITAFEAGRKQAGLPYVATSPGFLYGAINGGVDQGSFLEDGMEWMASKGSVKITTVGYLDWRRGRSLMNNAGALAEARSYRTVEVYECPTFDGMASALQQGFFIVEGLAWFDNFTPDRDGWLPARGAGGMGGHALAGYGLVQRNGVWGIRTRNSWGTSWGVGGNCVIPETLFDNRIGGFWAVRAVAQTALAPASSRFDVPFALGY